ncbi:MAG: hypothetical protein JXQ66_07925 [Campylobacterales bacterium]|nr:hypothetical protein [Campylobacterales bacterium]
MLNQIVGGSYMFKKISYSIAACALALSLPLCADGYESTTAKLNQNGVNEAIESMSIKINVVTGWNLISVPGYKPYKSADLLGGSDYIDKMFYWNSEAQEWKIFSADADLKSIITSKGFENFTGLVPGMGFWINAKKPFTLEFKTNLQSCPGVYEKAAMVTLKDETLGHAEGNLNPPMSIGTLSYSEAWKDDGSLGDEFKNEDGSVDWAGLDPSKFSQADWDSPLMFNADLLASRGFRDNSGNSFRFLNSETLNKLNVVIQKDEQITNGVALLRGSMLEMRFVGASEPFALYRLANIREVNGEKVFDLFNEKTQKPINWKVDKVLSKEDSTWIDPADALGVAPVSEIDFANLGENDLDAPLPSTLKEPICLTTNEEKIELTKRSDGSYPFPEDPDFPKECLASSSDENFFPVSDAELLAYVNQAADSLVETGENSEPTFDPCDVNQDGSVDQTEADQCADIGAVTDAQEGVLEDESLVETGGNTESLPEEGSDVLSEMAGSTEVILEDGTTATTTNMF